MSEFIDSILVDIYSGDKEKISDKELSRLMLKNELDEYVEESVRIFLNEMKAVSYIPIHGLRVASSIGLVSNLGIWLKLQKERTKATLGFNPFWSSKHLNFKPQRQIVKIWF